MYIYVYDTGHIKGEINDFKFENYKNVKKCIYRTFEQAGANICSIGYQNSNFEIGLSLFRYAGKYTILNKEHIVQC